VPDIGLLAGALLLYLSKSDVELALDKEKI
jgi:hypothetical protein